MVPEKATATVRNSRATVSGLSPGTHTVTFKSVSGFSKPSDQTVTLTSGATTTRTGSYIANTPSTYTLSLNSTPGGHATATPSGGNYAAGTHVRLRAYPDDGYVFDDWDGDANGSDRTIYITMDEDKSIMAGFDVDTSRGSVLVRCLLRVFRNW